MQRHPWRFAAAFALMLLLLVVAAFPSSALAARGQGQTPPPDPDDPQISIFWPPLAIMNWGIPSEHLHLKLNQPATVETLPVHVCLPGAGAVAVLPWFHLIWKPDSIQPGFGMFGDIADLIDELEAIGDDADDSDDAQERVEALLATLPGIGTVGVPMPRDQLGDYELEVFCIEILAAPPYVQLGRTSTAYSVEPYAYTDYVLSPSSGVPYEQDDADHAGPVSYWRLGDLPKGSRALTDSVGGHHGTYYADGGVHPALDRDGAPNCNVFARATSGCNDGLASIDLTPAVTKSFTADPATDVFTVTGHGWSNGDYVRLSGVTGITGVSDGAENEGPYYFIVNATADTFQLAASNAPGATVIDLGGSSGSGSVTSDAGSTPENTGITAPVVNDTDRAAFFTPGQYAAVQDYAAAEFTSGYTIEAWVNPYAVEDMGIFQHGYGPALRIEDGRFVFRQTTTDVVQASGDLPAAGEWFHVVGTWNGAGTAKLYVNGELVGSSSDATGVPSGGGSTLYIGRDEISPGTFNGAMDEVAYYTEPLANDAVALHYEIATYVQPAQSIINPLEYYLDVTRPKIEMNVPTEGAVFNQGKSVHIDFTKSDPDGLLPSPLGGDIVLCVPADGTLLDTATTGDKSLTVICTDRGLNVKTVTTHYSVQGFDEVVMNDDPVGYWRLDDAADSGVMEGYDTLPSGEYKNDTTGGPEGISGDANTTRSFLGEGGYGYVNGIEHPKWSYTMEAWVKLDDSGDAMIMQHGRGGALFVKDGRIVFRQTVTDVTSDTLASTLVDGDFHQVVGVWDGVYARLYIDGAQEGEDVYAPTPPSGFSTFYVGYGEYAPWIRGDMDEVSYYGTALSSERVNEHFLADPPAASAGASASAPSEPGTEGGPGTETRASDDGTALAPAKPLPRTSITRGGRTRVTGTGARLTATLPLVVRCPQATRSCTAIATLTRRYGSRALIGSAARTLTRGGRWTVRVRLTPKASKLLRAAGSMKVRASVKVSSRGAAPSSRVAHLVLRAP